jgi:hypothetical protein
MQVSSVAFSQDCTNLATAGRDDEVRTWAWEQPNLTVEATKSSVVSESAPPASKRASERIQQQQLEDSRNNRHWAFLCGDGSGKEEDDRSGVGLKPNVLPSRTPSVARGP